MHRLSLICVLLAAAFALGQSTSSNNSACSGNGDPTAGCNGVGNMPFLANPSDTGNQTTTVDPLPVATSTVSVKSLLYSGATTRLMVEYQPWFYNVSPYNGHQNIGMNESNSAQVLAQAQWMKTIGADVTDVDYYGCGPSCGQTSANAYNFSVTSALASAIAANPSTTPKFAIMLDKGAINGTGTGQCPPASGDQSSCLEAAIDAQIDYLAKTWLFQSYYEVNANNGHPIVLYFIDQTKWPGTNFNTVFSAVQSHATQGHSCGTGCTYSATVDFVDENAGAFSESGIAGGFAWPQPPTYSSTNQFCWEGNPCGFNYLSNFYSAARRNPSQIAIGVLSKGFNDYNANWGTNRVIAQQCGQVFGFTAAAIATAGYSSSSQLQYVQIATWNDYEEGTEVETGINNCLSVNQPSISGSTLYWTLAKSDPIYASTNTISKQQIWTGTSSPSVLYADNISPTATSYAAPSLSAGQGVWVYMVGGPLIQNSLSPEYAPTYETLTVSISGTGSVSSSPSGIACPPACSFAFSTGAVVTLTATPNSGVSFTGWLGGGCSGTGTCVVTLNSNVLVSAVFSGPSVSGFALTGPLAITGNFSLTGSGSAPPSCCMVTVVPATGETANDSQGGILNCTTSGGTCSASYSSGTFDTITATTSNNYVFTGFSGGGCPSAPVNRYPCTLTLTANQTVTLASQTNCNQGSTYPCFRTDLTAVTYPSAPPQVGSNVCSPSSLWLCGNLTGAGTLYTDPNFGSLGMRITDTTTGLSSVIDQAQFVDAGGSGDNSHFSCDDSMIYVSDTGGWNFPMNFFGMSSAPTRMYASSFGSNGFYFAGGAAWGHSCPTDAHRLFFMSGTVLEYYDFTGNCPGCTAPSATSVYDFTSSSNCLGSGFSETYNVFGESDQSDTDFAVGFSNNGAQGGAGTVYITVYRKGSGCIMLNTSNDVVTGDWGTTGAIPGTPCTGTIHNVKIGKGGGSDGWLIWAITNPSSGCSSGNNAQWIWYYSSTSLSSMLLPCTAQCSGHFTEGLTTFAMNPGNAVPNYLSAGSGITNPITLSGITPSAPPAGNGALDWHFGWNQLNDSYPFVGTSTRDTGLPDTQAWDDEVVGFQPIATSSGTPCQSGKPCQYRFASTFNTNLSPYFSATNAIGSLSQTGNYFMFASDWQNTLGATNSAGTSSSTNCVPHGPNWVANTAYASTPYASSYPANGGIITPTGSSNPGGYSYQVTTNGTSGATEPTTFNQTPPSTPGGTGGGTTTDGSAVWTNLGAAGNANICRSEAFVVQL